MTEKIDRLFDDDYIKKLQKKSAVALIEAILNNVSKKDSLYKIQRILYLKDILENKVVYFDENEEEILIEISKWYFRITNQTTPKWLQERVFKYYKANPGRIKIYDLKDFKIKKWTIDDVIKDAVLLSGNQIDNYQPDEQDINYWINLRKKNQELYFGIVICGELVGHMGGVAICSDEYQHMKEGVLSEDELKVGVADRDKIEFIYIPTIVILPQYRSPSLLKSFLKSFFIRLKEINKEKSLKSIIANVYTKEGRSLSEKLGFKFIVNHKDGGEIYNLDFSKISNKHSLIYKLLND